MRIYRFINSLAVLCLLLASCAPALRMRRSTSTLTAAFVGLRRRTTSTSKNWADPDTSYQHFLAKVPKPVVMMLYGSGIAVDFADRLAADQVPALDIRAGSMARAY